MRVASLQPPVRHVEEYEGKEKRKLEVGKPVEPEDGLIPSDWGDRITTTAKELFLPSNYPQSVSEDYGETRLWWFLRDVASNVVGYCSGAAIGSALGIHPVWGGAGMATFNLIRDRSSQVMGFAASFLAPMADKNPRPWILTGEMLESAGMTLETAAATFPEQILPIALSASLVRVVAGSMKGAGMANIGPRQAISDNLGEVSAKNGNQGFVATFLGAGIGLAAHTALSSAIGTGAASTAIAAVGSLGAIFSVARMVNALDMHPVNETTLERLARSLEQGQTVSPYESVWRELPSLTRVSRFPLGQSIEPLIADAARFAELERLYEGRNYLLDLVDDRPYVVLAEGSQGVDRFQAALQCIYLEQLQEEGVTGTELVSQSLAKTPDAPQAVLDEMERLGWSTDMIRLDDRGIRADWR